MFIEQWFRAETRSQIEFSMFMNMNAQYWAQF